MAKLDAGMTREAAFDLLQEHNKDAFHIEHGETVEATMRYFARPKWACPCPTHKWKSTVASAIWTNYTSIPITSHANKEAGNTARPTNRRWS